MHKRVLHIVGRMDRAGAETMLMNLYREIDRTKIQFDFAYFTNRQCDYDNEILSLGGRIVHIRGGNMLTRLLFLWMTLRKGDWRIVHTHTLFSSGLFLFIAMLAGVRKRVAHSHSTADRRNSNIVGHAYQCIMRWLFSFAPTDYVACGNAAAEYLFPGRSDVQIIPNAIDIDRFLNIHNNSSIRDLKMLPGALKILQVGRLDPVKNHILSVHIAAELKKANIDFQMFFVGEGIERHSIKESIKNFKLEEHVQVLGLREDIPELMNAADVMLMPSLYEGFPVTLVESQAAGLPAVISNNISGEVDLGLDLIRFVDLKDSPETWMISILTATEFAFPTTEKRRDLLEIRGFSARSGAQSLTSIYASI